MEASEARHSPERALWDAVVVGAGPAGSVAALHLARRGHRVLLLDRHAFPRDKVCGDGLLDDALRCLERAGVLNQVAAHGQAPAWCRVFSPGRIELRVPGRYLTIKRVVLDDIIRTEAVRLGADFAVRTVEGVAREGPDAFAVSLSDGGRVRSRCVLLATGANANLSKRCGFEVSERRSGVAVAIRQYVSSTFPLDDMVVSFDRAITPGYAWIFPLGGGEYNVGCGASQNSHGGKPPDLHAVLNAFMETFPLAKELARGTTHATRPKGAILRTGLSGAVPLSREGALAIGETIGTTFPTTGEGIGKAMESGELAAEAVSSYLSTGRQEALLAYRDMVETRLRPAYKGYLVAERWLARPWLADLICRRATKSRAYARLLAGVPMEAIDPTRAFSLRGLLTSLLR
jgi:geranylgeranyl reductase family protein